MPHELRPLPVLTMTMDHIVTVVMDAGEGHVSEWYNFIWDRTRAITTVSDYPFLCFIRCILLDIIGYYLYIIRILFVYY